MIRIYKDRDTKVVTKGAYEQFYKSLGYNIILDIKEDKQEIVEETVVETNNLDVTVTKPKRGSSNKKTKKED